MVEGGGKDKLPPKHQFGSTPCFKKEFRNLNQRIDELVRMNFLPSL